MTKDPNRIDIPGLITGGSMKSKITLYAAAPSRDPDQSVILGWNEEGNDIMDSQMEALGSCSLGDYGLDNPPGKGIWAFEGEICVTFSKGGDPMEPQDYDSGLHWEGKWRPPTDEEMTRWRGHKATHMTHKLKAEEIVTTPWPDPAILRGKQGPNSLSSGMVMRSSSDWCACGKHVSECCCGEDHSPPHHPSGRAYDEEDSL